MSATEVLRAVDLAPHSDGKLYGYHHGVVDADELDLEDWLVPIYDSGGYLALEIPPLPYYVYAHETGELVAAYEQTTVSGVKIRPTKHEMIEPTQVQNLLDVDDPRSVAVVHRDTVDEEVGVVEV